MDNKRTIDSLATIGALISSEDHIEAILDGLFEDYDNFIIVVSGYIPTLFMILKLFFFHKKNNLISINSLLVQYFKLILFLHHIFTRNQFSHNKFHSNSSRGARFHSHNPKKFLKNLDSRNKNHNSYNVSSST